jgi:hypothetical protein
MEKTESFNQWWSSLPKGRQEILREDKWMLAEASYNSLKDELDSANRQVEKLSSDVIEIMNVSTDRGVTNFSLTSAVEILRRAVLNGTSVDESTMKQIESMIGLNNG